MGVPGLDPLSPSKGDFVDPCLGDLIWILKLPEWLKGLLAFLLKPLVRAQGVEGVGWVRREGVSGALPLLFNPSWQAWPLLPSPPHPDSSLPPAPVVFSHSAC